MSRVGVFLLLALPLVGALAMHALGIVVIYQASRVLNLAHGAMAMVPAYLVYQLSTSGVPAALALVLGVGSGAVLGLVVERVFVRGLRRQGATGQTVGTVAALGLLVALALRVWGSTPRRSVEIFPHGGFEVGGALLQHGHIGLAATALVSAAALLALFRRTDLGLSMRGAASNPMGAALLGVNPSMTTSIAWGIGGALAALSGILLAAVTTLHPTTLSLSVLPAFVAALIGGLSSLSGALVGAIVVGIVQGLVPALDLVPGLGTFATQVGASQLVLAVLAFAVMSLRGQRLSMAEAEPSVPGGSPASRPIAARGRLTAGRLAAMGLVAVGLLLWPIVRGSVSFTLLGDAVQACVTLLVAVSLVMLTGWVGQISLGQAAFVGIGAFATGVLAREVPLPFPASLPVAAALAALAAALLGVVALRVRGLYLAVATLIFFWMADEYLFRSAWLVGAGGGSTIPRQRIGVSGSIPFLDFSERRTFYYVALAAAAAAVWGAVNLRDSKTGRAFFAVRGSETAAASLGIDVTRTKLLAFGISGLLAGVAGNLLIVSQGAASASQFGFGRSLFYLAVPVVGGLGSVGGAIAASVLFAGLEEVFFRVRALSGWLDVTSAGLLAVVLVAYPGGLAGIGPALARRAAAVRARMSALRRRRAPDGAETSDAPARPRATRGAGVAVLLATDRAARRPMLEAGSVTVRFGGLVALDGVSLAVREGEIVGLIGPNGAGKTTLFNAISGLVVPTTGTVRLFGTDVTALPVHGRAAMGLARTFQAIQLFPQISVFENLLVATHVRNPTGVLGHLAVSRPTLEAERAARERVRDVIAQFELEGIADRPVAGLPFGVLRMVELARAIVPAAPLVMLDEPASGLDNTETDRLAELLLHLRAALGLSMLLIEHDVRMVTAVSDHMCVLDQGRLIAEGPPGDVRRDRAVVDAYLGTAM